MMKRRETEKKYLNFIKSPKNSLPRIIIYSFFKNIVEKLAKGGGVFFVP
jgi:hypothetical protein